MSAMQNTASKIEGLNKEPSPVDQLRLWWSGPHTIWNAINRIIATPHPLVVEVGERSRASLQAWIAVTMSFLFVIGVFGSVAVQGLDASGWVLILLAVVMLAVYALSRSPFYRWGSWLVTGSAMIAGYGYVLTGQASSTVLDSFIPLAFILGSILLNPWSLFFWIVAGVSGLFFIPTRFGVDVGTASGNFMTLGVLLLVSVIFRNNIERGRLAELRAANNELKSVNDDLKLLQNGLEQRVAERTRNLELAAEVGRSVSQVGSLEDMLNNATELIREQFDLYYVQVYLNNQAQNTLVLQSGTGSVGAELRARGHRLSIDTTSINGRAAVEKRPIIISDTTASATFLPNPLLPNTLSEMAIPLIVGERVVGVLDMQSHIRGSLSNEILPAFEALAGQLAIAIQNAELLADAEEARAEVENQARRLVRTNWQEYLDAIHKPEQTGFVFEQNKVNPLIDNGIDPSLETNAVTAPIAVTGETLGSLVVEIAEENQTPQNLDLVNTVARQVAQQIENLRLLENAERFRREAEQVVLRQTREGWQEYIGSRGEENLGYLYDLNQVRPHIAVHGESGDVTLPLKVRDQAVGKLAIKGIEAHDSDALELANAVAERLSAHIENLRQSDQTQSALAQSERLFEASRSLTQATDLQELVNAAVSTLNIPAINRAVLATFNFDRSDNVDSLDIIANWWNGTGQEVSPIGTHYSLDVIRVMPMFISPTPVFFNDTVEDERVDNVTLELVKRLNLRAVGILPLHLGSRQIGALILEAEEPHIFTQDEIRLFSALAPQIATVMENRRQFERTQKQAEREATLNAISQKIQSATTVEAVLQIASRELGHALGAPLTIAQLGMKDNGNGNN